MTRKESTGVQLLPKSPTNDGKKKWIIVVTILRWLGLRRLWQTIKHRHKDERGEESHSQDEMGQQCYEIMDFSWKDWRKSGERKTKQGLELLKNCSLSEEVLPYRRLAIVEEIEKHIWFEWKSLREVRSEFVVQERLKEFGLL